MGKRGPAPEPTRLKLIKGTNKKRPDLVNLNEPRPVPGEARRPVYLSALASEEWDRVLPHLTHMGTLSDADTTALAVYCEAVARWRKLAEVVASSPPVLSRDGILIKNPAYSQIRDAAIEVRLYAREFGLTPSARSGIRIEHVISGDAGRLLTNG